MCVLRIRDTPCHQGHIVGPHTRYVKMCVAHAPGIPGTFSSPPTSTETDSLASRHESRHVHIVPWCMSGSLARDGGQKFPGACATRSLAYLVKGLYCEPQITEILAYVQHYQWHFLKPILPLVIIWVDTDSYCFIMLYLASYSTNYHQWPLLLTFNPSMDTLPVAR